MKTCPVCGGVLDTLQDVVVGVLMIAAVGLDVVVRHEPRRVIACTECEYIQESTR